MLGSPLPYNYYAAHNRQYDPTWQEGVTRNEESACDFTIAMPMLLARKGLQIVVANAQTLPGVRREL